MNIPYTENYLTILLTFTDLCGTGKCQNTVGQNYSLGDIRFSIIKILFGIIEKEEIQH